MADSKLSERVAERLAALHMTAVEAARRSNLKRTFVQDLLSGRKEGMSASALLSLSDVLHCSPEYLMGRRDQVSEHARSETSEIEIGGVCQTGVWRDERINLPMPKTFSAILPDYSASQGIAFLVHGIGAEDIGVLPQSVVIGVKPEFLRDRVIGRGDVVVLRRYRKESHQAEVSIRKLFSYEGAIRLDIPSKSFAEIEPLTVPATSPLFAPPFRIDAKGNASEQLQILAVVMRSILLISRDAG